MNRYFFLIILSIFIIMFPLSVLTAGITDELTYINENTDFYVYTNISRIMKFLAARGINTGELDSFAAGSPAASNGNILKDFGLKPSDINEIMLAVNLQDTAKKSGYLVFISIKNGRGHIPVNLRKNTVKLKSGTVYKAPVDEDIVFTRMSDFFIFGPSAYLESFLEKKSLKKNMLTSRSGHFKKNSEGKSVYIHLTVTDFFTAEINRVLNSSEGRRLKNNAFIKTLTTLECADWSIETGDRIIFTSGMQGSKPEDSERLLMITHTWIVGTSFLVSFADLFLMKDGNQSPAEISSEGEITTWLQKAFGRIHVRQEGKGVVSTLEMVPGEADVVITYIKNEIEKEKKERAERSEREKIAKLTGAIKQNNIENVKMYIKGKYNLNGFDTDGNTPLGVSAVTGNLRIARLLVENGAKVNAWNVDKMMPLHLAVKNDRTEMIAFLLGKGADVNGKADNHFTPHQYNALQGNSEITRILIVRGATVNAKDSDGSTPLHYASSQGFIKVVKVLIEKKADPDIKNKNSQRSVDVAAQNNQNEIVNFFRSSFGQKPETFMPEEDEFDYNSGFEMNDDPDDEILDE